MLDRPSAARWLPAACLILATVWYPVLTILLGFLPFAPVESGLAFNSMAERLLAGRFDIDPDAIGAEGYEQGDRTVSYFGIFCALLRIPLVMTPGLAGVDITWWSCLAAIWIAVWFQIRTVTLVWRARPEQGFLVAALLISVVLGGQHVQFLYISVFQETIDWGFAEAAIFVFLAMRGTLMPHGFDTRTIGLMALCAGLALLTRVTFGIGLYAALGLFLLVRWRPRTWPVPAAILLAFVGCTGVVNAGRWGNPLVFVDLTHYGMSLDAMPERLGHVAAYGAFHLSRLWLGLIYYFFPIWAWIRSDGLVLFAEAQARSIDALELPPGSFLLTDPLLLGLAGMGVVAIRDRGRAALLIGLAIPPALMLCAISMAHRYRMEFYSCLFLAALFGLIVREWQGDKGQGHKGARNALGHKGVIAACVAIGIAASHAMAVVYVWSPAGPAEFYLERYGLIGTYTRPPR